MRAARWMPQWSLLETSTKLLLWMRRTSRKAFHPREGISGEDFLLLLIFLLGPCFHYHFTNFHLLFQLPGKKCSDILILTVWNIYWNSLQNTISLGRCPRCWLNLLHDTHPLEGLPRLILLQQFWPSSSKHVLCFHFLKIVLDDPIETCIMLAIVSAVHHRSCSIRGWTRWYFFSNCCRRCTV